MLIRPLGILLLFAIPRLSLAQPAESVPPPPPNYDLFRNYDGNAAFTGNDFGKVNTDMTLGFDYYINATLNRPQNVSGVSATITGQSIAVSWMNPASTATHRYITIDGVQAAALPASATSHTLVAVAEGPHIIAVHTRNIVTTGPYAGTWAPAGSPPAVPVTVVGPPAPTGACCAPSGSCSVLTAAQCTAAGGVYKGNGVTCAAAGCTAPPPTGSGWTAFPNPSAVYYASASGTGTGCTQAQPCSFSTGLGKLRANTTDQLLLKAGDTFNIGTVDLNKGSGNSTSYMVIGTYSATPANPRAKIRSSDSAFNFANVRGLAIVDLDIQPVSGHPGNAMWIPETNQDILIEGNYIAGYGVNVASHAVNGGQIRNLKARRNVIVDGHSPLPQSGHNWFCGDQVGFLFEENVLDRGGRDGGEQTIFRRNFYAHDNGSTPATILWNLHARSCSDSMQVRMGGTVRGNLSLQNPTAMTWGGNGVFSWNVAIDARDINNIDRRGIGFSLSGSGTVEHNACAYQVSGTDAVSAFGMDSFTGDFRGNYVYDWKAPGNAGWATAVEWNGANVGPVTCSDNRLFMPNNGMIWRHESRNTSGFTYRNGTYFTSTPVGGANGYMQFSTASGQGQAWSQWQPRETGSTFISSAPPNPNANVGAYLTSVGITPGSDPIATFMSHAKTYSKQNDSTPCTARKFIVWFAARTGMGSVPN